MSEMTRQVPSEVLSVVRGRWCAIEQACGCWDRACPHVNCWSVTAWLDCPEDIGLEVVSTHDEVQVSVGKGRDLAGGLLSFSAISGYASRPAEDVTREVTAAIERATRVARTHGGLSGRPVELALCGCVQCAALRGEVE